MMKKKMKSARHKTEIMKFLVLKVITYKYPTGRLSCFVIALQDTKQMPIMKI